MGEETVEVRRVGFRFGTDEELAAMHLVESEIEAERWPGRAPQPLERYLAFARSLPSQFDDHTWLAEAQDGTPAGCSACWSNAAGDPQVMESYVYVRPSWRNRGVGWRLAKAVIDEAERDGRGLLMWTTYDSAPAGEAFSRRLGGRVGRIHRNSELRLGDLDWEMVRRWIDDGPLRAPGYRLEPWEGPYPVAMLADIRNLGAHRQLSAEHRYPPRPPRPGPSQVGQSLHARPDQGRAPGGEPGSDRKRVLE